MIRVPIFTCKIEVPFHAVLKNSKAIRFNRKTGSRFITSSTRALQAKAYLSRVLLQEKIEQHFMTIEEPIILKVTFHMNNYYTKDDEVSKKLPDISNLYQLIEDVLEDVGIIENDRLIEGHDGSRRVPSDDDKNWLTIEIYQV